MTAPLVIYIVRHGEVHNPTKILYGRLPDFRLSDVGRDQARSAGNALWGKPIAAIYASPLQRAQETAEIIVQTRAQVLPVQADDRLLEVHTPYDGTTHEELEKTFFDLYTGTKPPFEQPGDIRRRMLAFIADMRVKHANQHIAAVTHGDVVVAMFLYAKKQAENNIGRGQLEALGLIERYPVTASISTLTYRSSNPDEVPEYNYLRPY
jgi:broad specificity phosphatase PhoE